MTPVEVFQPHYGRGLAKYISEQAHGHQSAIHINELGGGTGTLARNVLVGFVRPLSALQLAKQHLCQFLKFYLQNPSWVSLKERLEHQQHGGWPF